MIQDTLDNSACYEALSSHFAKAFAYLRTVDGTQTTGRHDIDGDNLFALVQTYATKPVEGALFEAHRKYIDVQFLHSGGEIILWAPLALMKEQTRAYDEAKDAALSAALWKLVPEGTPLHLSAGQFVILFPQDAHAPGVKRGEVGRRLQSGCEGRRDRERGMMSFA